MKTLLHACCGPCSLEPSRILAEEGHELILAFCNSNIHPREEYDRRLETLAAYAASQDLEMLEGGYDPALWEERVGVLGADRRERCRACYRLRFQEAARMAWGQGCQALSTTLSVSPYQFTDLIEEELERAAREVGLVPLFRDFRENYPEATRRSLELGMYRQNYCGCRFSQEEARLERAARKVERKAEKAQLRSKEMEQAMALLEEARRRGCDPEELQALEEEAARCRGLADAARERLAEAEEEMRG